MFSFPRRPCELIKITSGLIWMLELVSLLFFVCQCMTLWCTVFYHFYVCKWMLMFFFLYLFILSFVFFAPYRGWERGVEFSLQWSSILVCWVPASTLPKHWAAISLLVLIFRPRWGLCLYVYLYFFFRSLTGEPALSGQPMFCLV